MFENGNTASDGISTGTGTAAAGEGLATIGGACPFPSAGKGDGASVDPSARAALASGAPNENCTA
jgi:hypothetical protein